MSESRKPWMEREFFISDYQARFSVESLQHTRPITAKRPTASRRIEEEELEIEHRTENQEGELGSHRESGECGRDEGIRGAADREDGCESHEGDDGQRGIRGKRQNNLLIHRRAKEGGGRRTDHEIDGDIEKVPRGNLRDILKSIKHSSRSSVIMVMIMFGGHQSGPQDREGGEETDHPANKNGNREAQRKTKNGHFPSTLSSERGKRTQDHQGIHNRGGQHVGDTAGNGKSLPEETSHNGDDAALADGEDDAE